MLRELRDYNLNAFTLFGSDESLMTALSQREEPDTQGAAQYMIFKLGVVALATLISLPALAKTITGRASIIDGDMLEIHGHVFAYRA